jgi:hypothetical protein
MWIAVVVLLVSFSTVHGEFPADLTEILRTVRQVRDAMIVDFNDPAGNQFKTAATPFLQDMHQLYDGFRHGNGNRLNDVFDYHMLTQNTEHYQKFVIAAQKGLELLRETNLLDEPRVEYLLQYSFWLLHEFMMMENLSILIDQMTRNSSRPEVISYRTTCMDFILNDVVSEHYWEKRDAIVYFGESKDGRLKDVVPPPTSFRGVSRVDRLP